MATVRLMPVGAKGRSCTDTIIAALQDADLRPEVVHVVGASEAELSMDFDALAKVLPAGARLVLVGPGAAEKEPVEELVGPATISGLQVSVFASTYQRFMMRCHEAEAPQLVVLFHPGLDIHYFAWYECMRKWAADRVPVLVTAFAMPDALGETPDTVEALLGALVGNGGGAGLWVIEKENPCSAEDGKFNAAYFLLQGSQGELPALPEELYFELFQTLRKVGHPFAPRVGYLDIGDEALALVSNPSNPKLLAAIAEGAVRAALVGDDACDEDTARSFAVTVLDQALGEGAGELWRRGGVQRRRCENCGDGFDEEAWHRTICPAVGRSNDLRVGDRVRLARLQREEYNGREGTLDRFDRIKQRWVMKMKDSTGGDKDAMFRALNLDLI